MSQHTIELDLERQEITDGSQIPSMKFPLLDQAKFLLLTKPSTDHGEPALKETVQVIFNELLQRQQAIEDDQRQIVLHRVREELNKVIETNQKGYSREIAALQAQLQHQSVQPTGFNLGKKQTEEPTSGQQLQKLRNEVRDLRV